MALCRASCGALSPQLCLCSLILLLNTGLPSLFFVLVSFVHSFYIDCGFSFTCLCSLFKTFLCSHKIVPVRSPGDESRGSGAPKPIRIRNCASWVPWVFRTVVLGIFVPEKPKILDGSLTCQQLPLHSLSACRTCTMQTMRVAALLGAWKSLWQSPFAGGRRIVNDFHVFTCWEPQPFMSGKAEPFLFGVGS